MSLLTDGISDASCVLFQAPDWIKQSYMTAHIIGPNANRVKALAIVGLTLDLVCRRQMC